MNQISHKKEESGKIIYKFTLLIIS